MLKAEESELVLSLLSWVISLMLKHLFYQTYIKSRINNESNVRFGFECVSKLGSLYLTITIFM